MVLAVDRDVRGGLLLLQMAIRFTQALAKRWLLRLGQVVSQLFKRLFQLR